MAASTLAPSSVCRSGRGLEELTLAELRSLSEKIDEDVARVLAYETAMKRRNTPGGTAPERVWEQIVALKDWLAHAQS